MTISIIIPVENESTIIKSLLEYLTPLKSECEIIFVDGGSTDDTAELIENWIQERVRDRGHFSVSQSETEKCPLSRFLRSPQNGRANQMNYGASIAGGEALWFLHADSAPPADALDRIREVLCNGYQAGCFRLRFDSSHPLMLYNSLASNLRVRSRGIAFGDQGIFILKEFFNKIGGYAPIPLMEDYQLSMDIIKAGLSFGVAKGWITTSARRYRTHGMLRTMLKMQALQRRFRRGDDMEEIAKEYDS